MSHHPTSDTAQHQRCQIIPDYLLRQLAATDHQGAPATLLLDSHIRSARQGHRSDPHGRPSAATATPAAQRTIADAGGATTLPGATVRREGAAAVDDPAVNEAYDGLGATWNLWWQVYGRNSLDGQGLPLQATVHYGTDYLNAFWNGDRMVFGDGDGRTFVRFTKSVDVIAHELTHGVTENTAGLEYHDQPGALNESISDVFGVLTKQHLLGQTADQADWLVGADILGPDIQGRALRSMIEPGSAYDDPTLGKDPQPADMAHYVTTGDDNGGVHINSGIPNRAFALAATTLGGHAWQRAGQIWVDVLTGSQITPQCDFATFAQLTLDAAAQRYGDGSPEHAAVAQAWQTVGVRQPDAPEQPHTDPLDQTRDDPKPTPNTGVLDLTRSGGFAGVSKARVVPLDELPEVDTRHWLEVLGTGELEALPDQTHPDGYVYAVRCDHPPCDTHVAEHALPQHTRSLFERTLEG